MRPKIECDPKAVDEARRLYERTVTPLGDIAALLGVSRRTLISRIREWDWPPRRMLGRRIELHHALRGAAMADATAAANDGSTPAAEPTASTALAERQHATAVRILDAVDVELDLIKRALEPLAPKDPAEAESVTRSIASVSQALRDAAALIQPERPRQANDRGRDAVPLDIDALRSELAAHLEALIADAAGDAGAGDGEHSRSPLPGAEQG